MTNILIAYFSHTGENYFDGDIIEIDTGNTAIAARIMEKITGGDLFEIIAAKPYPTGYRECVETAKRELNDDARPTIVDLPSNTANYDFIILGYPNWCGTMPMPVWTFLESVDTKGKKILPLCTNEGSGMGRSEADIAKLCPEAHICKGLSIKGSRAAEAGEKIGHWLGKTLAEYR